MEALIDSIRVALRDGATDDERRRAAENCRALADTLEPTPAPPVDEPPPSVALTVAPTVAPIATAPAAASAPLAMNPFAGMSADQILDLAIAKLRAAAGPVDADTVGKGFRLTLVPVPRIS
jgi:hypothetical protein